LDFDNTVLRPSVKNVAVNGKDVLNVRVARHQSAPPVIRVVIDLSGPRKYDLVRSPSQITVRINQEETAAREYAPKSLPSPASSAASAKAGPVVETTPALPKPVVVTSTPAKTNIVAATSKPAPATAKFSPMVVPPTEKPVDASTPRPASKPVFEDKTSVPAKSQPTASVEPPPPAKVQVSASVEPPTPETFGPSPAPAVVPQVQSVQEKLSSASTSAQPQEAAVSAPRPAPDSKSFDPAIRAGAAAGTMSVSPQSSPVEMAQLTAPGQLPGGAAPTAASQPKYTGEPISVNLKDVDLKDFFRLIHEISGLNIVLDPSVRGNVTLVLDDVPWDQALDIVLKNNALDRELQGNVLRIAASDTLRKEAVDRRAQSEAVALAVDRQTITRFLSYSKAAQVVPTIKKFLTARGDVISDDRTNALIISDIPSVLPNLDRLISQLDRKSQEVEIEVRVVSASRTFSRDLGVQLGFNWGNGVSTIGGSNPNGTTSTTTSSGTVPLFTSFSAPGATTGFSISNITKNYGIDAVLTAAEEHNLAKVLSRPRVVTQSNVKAEVKQGVKIPVLTASTANANASVSYVDAVLRLSVTPQITSDNTIFLTVDVENTQPSGILNTNYILTTQQINTQILVTDGGTVVIGGVIQTTNSVSTSQTPLLGDIPWLGNLFKQRTVKTETDELIFFITPKIIQT
jgi:type IV pilus assembly protein PilQ